MIKKQEQTNLTILLFGKISDNESNKLSELGTVVPIGLPYVRGDEKVDDKVQIFLDSKLSKLEFKSENAIAILKGEVAIADAIKLQLDKLGIKCFSAVFGIRNNTEPGRPELLFLRQIRGSLTINL